MDNTIPKINPGAPSTEEGAINLPQIKPSADNQSEKVIFKNRLSFKLVNEF